MYRKYIEPDFMPTRAEMLELIAQYTRGISGIETLPAAESMGRILAADVVSLNTLPNTKTVRLDGIGVRFADFEHAMPDTSAWREGGDFCFVNTGTALPEAFDTEIIVEEISYEAEVLTIHTPPALRGQYISEPGTHMQAGELLARAGSVVTPTQLGLFASGGVFSVSVLRRPQIAILPSGDELIKPCTPVPQGKNIESNSAMIAGFLRMWGAEPIVFDIIRDDAEALRGALKDALAQYDAAILIAGSSKGTKDFAEDAFSSVGKLVAPELAHGPGKHSSLTVCPDGKVALGIAGPPFGAHIFSMLYLRPFVDCLLGRPMHLYETVEVLLDCDFPPYEVDFCAALHVWREGEVYKAAPVMKGGDRTRAKTVADLNAILYRSAGHSAARGETLRVELLVPRENIPVIFPPAP